MKKGFKVLIVVFILTVAVASGVYMAFYNNDYTPKNNRVDLNLLLKLKTSAVTGGKVQLSNEDINAIVDTYCKNDIKYGDITIKGIDLYMENNLLKIYVPIKYKNYNFLVTSRGSLEYSDDKFVFTPEYANLGKLNIPKSFLFDKIKVALKNNKYIYVEDNKINISVKSILYLKSFDIKGSKAEIILKNVSLK